ncbi:hypothetical protein [Bartonella krasnovii]|uniref:Phage protein n=1 Tax=Bartonella krasnovii TaxID=2267275 RepID=A0A5B9CZ49_9HYPH|nr:hypothetical protein [Bartonella krasnovii]QEE11566.1 hypothetical protein D1092_00630 [Bartonella krasnovii]UNF29319.1 hypothetical protein MNL13_00590 [Bartonella krasnovii]UNF35676.1 hypothetical protein MNL12_00590 [Bartonella krasnovii]UNF37297.1 hypothetical protein MNL11_00605 [Bartonella krasnovii]UNF38989.1 hypothetical protein MNL10_00585 [Bartonella krasnovii]
MQKIFMQGLLTANILAYSSVAFAGFGEREWNFETNETVTIGASDEIQQGAEYGCKAFKPEKASFTLSYSSPSDVNKLHITADDEKKITHDKERKIFMLKDVKSLDIGFPPSGYYTFKNITKERVIGLDCDAGDF